MILNKPYTTKQYAYFAVYCNQNELIIEDKGDYLETTTKPIINLNYSEKRLIEYPEIGEQLDLIYHDFDNWKVVISEIKAKYPK